jgi:hypothetical protein
MKKRGKKERRDLSPIHPPMPQAQAVTYAAALAAQKEFRAQLVKATQKGHVVPLVGLAEVKPVHPSHEPTYKLIVWTNAVFEIREFAGFPVEHRESLPAPRSR